MCGRYAASRRPEDLVEEFEVDATEGGGPGGDPSGMAADFNVAPTKQAPVVLERVPRGAPVDPTQRPEREPDDPAAGVADDDGEATADAAVAAAEEALAERSAPEPLRLLRLLTWGLVPSWAPDRSAGSRMINARAETLLDRPGYRRAALARRCLVPADGWYEWQVSPTEKDAKGKPRKQPFFIRPISGGSVAFAGVYELWRDRAVHAADPAAWLATYAVITTAAEPGLDVIHERMPFVLPADRWDDWLDPDQRDPDAVRALLRPSVLGRFEALPISTRVNNVRGNGPELLEPLPWDQLRGVVDPRTGELAGAEAPLF